VKLIGLFDSLGWWFGWSLCKRKTLNGTKLEKVPISDTVNQLLRLLPSTKKYHLFVDSWFLSEALVTSITSKGYEITGACSSLRFRLLWKDLDQQLDEQRKINPTVKFTSAQTKLITGQPIWAVSVVNGKKKGEEKNTFKNLHYISSHIDSKICVKAEKNELDDDGKRKKKLRQVPLIKQLYDQHFTYEDACDQAGAEVVSAIRNMAWERATIVGILSMLLANNALLLYWYATDDLTFTKAQFVTEIAYAMADYNHIRKHQLVPRSRGGYAVCAWWKVHKRDLKQQHTTQGCERCNVRVCAPCWRWHHAHYVCEK